MTRRNLNTSEQIQVVDLLRRWEAEDQHAHVGFRVLADHITEELQIPPLTEANARGVANALGIDSHFNKHTAPAETPELDDLQRKLDDLQQQVVVCQRGFHKLADRVTTLEDLLAITGDTK